jgi:hypothetical protein
VLQARLVAFWRSCKPTESKASEYDPTTAHEWYETFRRDFIDTLPPAFALEPNLQWDAQLPQLPMQRQLLYTAIFDSICHNFRPLLLLEPAHVRSLPAYKQVLLSSQGAILAHSALNVLESVSMLSQMLGATYTRLVAIIFHTFEAGALLLCLCIRGTVKDPDQGGYPSPPDTSWASYASRTVGGSVEVNVTRRQCVQAAKDALAHLERLSEVSGMAEAGARSLAQLLAQLDGAASEAMVPVGVPHLGEKECDERNGTPVEGWLEITDTAMGSDMTLAGLNGGYFDPASLSDLWDIGLEDGAQSWDTF